MIPDPADVAKLLKKTVFKSKKDKKRQAEIERTLQIRNAKTHMQQHVQQQKEMVLRYKTLAKKALSLNDEARFKQAGAQMLAAQKDVSRWEKYLLSFELLETRTQQAQATRELAGAINMLGQSLQELSEPVNMQAIQTQVEKGLAQASNMEERMDAMMNVMDLALEGVPETAQADLASVESSLTAEIQQQEAREFDPEMEAALESLRSEMKA